ncbi:MAG: hypothetical protein KF906_11380 [Actinobacteria bacterium]|nr:hypothetical protein [Actinomycetota bacterium]
MSASAVLVGAAPTAVHEVHRAFAWFVVVANGLVGAWALAADRWEQLRRPVLWQATWVAHGSIFVQVALGVWSAQGIESDHLQMHMFYGFIAAFSVAIIFSYRSQLAEHRYKLYGFGGLFLMGLGIRAMVLNPLA